MKAKLQEISFWLIPIIIGGICFLVVMGPYVINPLNVAWLGDGYDPTQHYLGWVFYRQSPWTFPIGMNPQYGLEISSSVVFSDSIPLFAFLFKLIHPILPDTFQYIGIWNFLCFILQAWFAWLIVSFLTTNTITKILAITLFLIAPPMLFRLGLHAALSAHFLILASLYLNLREGKSYQRRYWIILLLCAALTHFYLFFMVASLWFADLMDRQHSKNWKNFFHSICIEVIIVSAGLAIVAWQAGYFSVSTMSAATGHYGLYNFNLLAPFQSDGWSYVWRDWAHPVNGEGFNYFGLGVIALFGISIFAAPKVLQLVNIRLWFSRHRFFLLALLFLFLVAMSNRIVIGAWEYTFEIPLWLYRSASILRGSGRLFWPIWYCLLIGFLFLTIKRFPSAIVNGLLFVVVSIQLVDTSAGWLPKRSIFTLKPVNELGSPLKDIFWENAAKHYKKVLRSALPISPIYYYIGWDTWAKYAAKYHLGTNSAWLSRYNQSNLVAANEAIEQQLQTGRYDLNALYILENDKVIPSLLHFDPHTDLLAKIDGYYVLAPGWLNCKLCPPVRSDQVVNTEQLIPKLGEEINFGRINEPKYLLNVSQGWAHPESWGIWSDGNQAQLILGIPKEGANYLILTARAFTNSKIPQQIIDIAINDHHHEQVILKKDSDNQILIPISNEDRKKGFLNIIFSFKNPARPKDFGMGDDDRLLSLGLERARFK